MTPDSLNQLILFLFSVEKFDMAVQAAANFLVFDPTHDGMLENKNILTTTEGYTEKDFVPQQVSWVDGYPQPRL